MRRQAVRRLIAGCNTRNDSDRDGEQDNRKFRAQVAGALTFGLCGER